MAFLYWQIYQLRHIDQLTLCIADSCYTCTSQRFRQLLKDTLAHISLLDYSNVMLFMAYD